MKSISEETCGASQPEIILVEMHAAIQINPFGFLDVGSPAGNAEHCIIMFQVDAGRTKVGK